MTPHLPEKINTPQLSFFHGSMVIHKHYWKLNTQKNTNAVRKIFFGHPSEKYTQKYNDREIKFFYVFAVTNSFSVSTCI